MGSYSSDGKGKYSIPIDFPDSRDIQPEYRNKTLTVMFDKNKPPRVDNNVLTGGALRYVRNLMRT